MIGIGRVYILGIGLGQLLTSKTHSNLNSRKKITKDWQCLPIISIFLQGKKFTLSSTTPEHPRNCLTLKGQTHDHSFQASMPIN